MYVFGLNFGKACAKTTEQTRHCSAVHTTNSTYSMTRNPRRVTTARLSAKKTTPCHTACRTRPAPSCMHTDARRRATRAPRGARHRAVSEWRAPRRAPVARTVQSTALVATGLHSAAEARAWAWVVEVCAERRRSKCVAVGSCQSAEIDPADLCQFSDAGRSKDAPFPAQQDNHIKRLK